MVTIIITDICRCIFQTKGVVRVQNGAACVIYVLPRRLHALIAGMNKTTLLPSDDRNHGMTITVTQQQCSIYIEHLTDTVTTALTHSVTCKYRLKM